MRDQLDIRARCIAVPAGLRATGIRCFVQVVVFDNLHIDGLTVRVTESGKAMVTWPVRPDSRGRHHQVVRILHEATRLAVERAVLDEAVRGGWLEADRASPLTQKGG